MFLIHAINVNDALPQGLRLLNDQGVAYSSRNGPMIEAPGPVTTTLQYPDQRVLFSARRDANPFFHFFESLWMLAGRDDLGFVQYFNSNIQNYSSTDVYGREYFYGAYGARWRRVLGVQQIDRVIEMLRRDPDSRRVVLQMWSPKLDLGVNSPDLPCNTNIYFRSRDRVLHTTICNRSNDIVWGLYGANAVHMSFLHEYVARSCGMFVGPMTTVSNSFHLYPNIPIQSDLLINGAGDSCEDAYQAPFEKSVYPQPLIRSDETREMFDKDTRRFFGLFDEYIGSFLRSGWETVFFKNTVIPMWNAWDDWKVKNRRGAVSLAREIESSDWRLACVAWMERRIKKEEEK